MVEFGLDWSVGAEQNVGQIMSANEILPKLFISDIF